MFFSNHRVATIRSVFNGLYFSYFGPSVSAKQNTSKSCDKLDLNLPLASNRSNICRSICLAMMFVSVLQSFKLVGLSQYLSAHALILHLINLSAHLCLFWLVLRLLKHNQFTLARTLFIVSFCSYLSIACLLWELDLRLQYYFLLALFITSYLIDSNEKILLSLCISCQLLAFTGFTWFLPELSMIQVPLLAEPLSVNFVQAMKNLALANSITFAISCCICAFFIRFTLSQNWHQLRRYESQQQALINRVFPNQMGHDLIALGEKQQNHLFQSKTMAVLFLDICGFTDGLFKQESSWRSTYALFAEFDKLTAHLDCKRIKTNGDQYILVIGMQSQNADERDTAKKALAASISIAKHVKATAVQSTDNVRVRQGVSFGTVMFGIFDTNSPVFDVWGETVVRAARLEAFAEADQIIVDHDLHQYTCSTISYLPCVTLSLKGIGPTKTYAVNTCAEI